MNTLKNSKTCDWPSLRVLIHSAGYSIVDDSNQRVVVMSDLFEKLKFASQITEFDVPLLEKNLGAPMVPSSQVCFLILIL